MKLHPQASYGYLFLNKQTEETIMKHHIKLFFYFLLALALVLLFNAHTAYAQDAVEIIDYGNATLVYFYGYDQQNLPPTKYPDLEQTAQNDLKIWGGPCLTTEEQICYSFVNTSKEDVLYSYNYNIEIEISGQWYLVLSEYCSLAGAYFRLWPGWNFVNSVRDDNRHKLHTGKYRIIMGSRYGEFEIVEPSINLPEKPTAYDWQFLNLSIMSKIDIHTNWEYLYDEAEQDGLSLIIIENQPITTTAEYIYFSVDLETDFIPFWKDLYFETKIDGMWRTLAYYDMGIPYLPDYYNQIPYFAYYRMGYFQYTTPMVLTPNKVSFPRVWAPAGPFVGEHRICGNLFVDFDKTVLAYGEFEIVEATDANRAATGASAWAQESIEAAIAADLVPQNLQGDYQQPITRAEFTALTLAFLENESGSSTTELLRQKNLAVEKGVFSDTDDDFVLAAYSLGIVEGMGKGIFDPHGNITREQLATMLTRTLTALNSSIAPSIASTYTDRNLFSAWAAPSINYVSEHKIMNGVGNNRFDPQGSCTREQAIVTFFRMIDN